MLTRQRTRQQQRNDETRDRVDDRADNRVDDIADDGHEDRHEDAADVRAEADANSIDGKDNRPLTFEQTMQLRQFDAEQRKLELELQIRLEEVRAR